MEGEDPTSQVLNFNPLLGSLGKVERTKNPLIAEYEKLLAGCRSKKDSDAVMTRAKKDKIHIQNNSGFISQAERQCTNCVDRDTQILTLSGWKSWDEVSVGDKILSFNTETQLIEEDSILEVYKYHQDTDAIRIKHGGLDCVSTLNHRWPLFSRNTGKVSFETTEHISKYKGYGIKKIIKSADNRLASTCALSDSELYLLGILLTDGHVYNVPNKHQMSDRYSCSIIQSTAKKRILDKIETKLQLASIGYTKRPRKQLNSTAPLSYTFFIHQPTSTRWGKMFPNKQLTYEFINSLSQHQAEVLLEGIVDGDGWRERGSKGSTIITSRKDQADALQYLIVRAGRASTLRVLDYRGKKYYSEKLTNKDGCVEVKNLYYSIRVHSRRYSDVIAKNCSLEKLDFVWCVRTHNSTWIARSASGYTFITGNSRVQSSAATMSKKALIRLWNDPEMQRMQFMPLILVHDEIIGECPVEYADQVAERMSSIMKHAAEPECAVPFKVDASIVGKDHPGDGWYAEEYYDDLQKEFNDLLADGVLVQDAISQILSNHTEILREDFDNHIKLPSQKEPA